MRRIRIIEQISLDGVIQQSADDGDFPYSNWAAPYRTPAGRDVILAAYGESFDLLLGRRTYDMWSGFWPKAPSSPMADRLNAGQHESSGIGRHSQHLQAERSFADRHHGRVGVSQRQRGWGKERAQMRKLIFAINTRSLNSAEDKNTGIVRTNLRDEILKLKQEQGKNILVGGVNIPSQLMELGLVDEFRFVVGPTLAGAGRRLLEGVSLPEKLQLRLVESKFFKSGCVALHYQKQ